jgi:N-acetylglucosamine-6-phosphate deacetylase
MIAILAGQVLTPFTRIAPGVILIEDRKIVAVGSPPEVPIPPDSTILIAWDKIAVPGFVDTHTHAGEGIYFGEAAETTSRLCRSIVRTGVTSLLPTLAGLLPIHYTLDMYLDRIRVIRQAMLQNTGGAEILGIHMEGPYLSQAAKVIGSQVADNLRQPSVQELRQMIKVSEGVLRKMTIAPELEHALEVITAMSEENIVPSAGHSAATDQQTRQAVQAGLRCATHVFNGMLPLHHRQPGLIGVILTCDQINAELIADGQHVSPTAMDLLLRCKGVDGVHLVTDHTIWAGLPNGEYLDGNRTIVKEDFCAFVVGGTLIGGVAPMNACVRNLVHEVGRSLAEAVQMASSNPARVIGIEDRKGSLKPGKDADLLLIDEQVRVYLTMVKGEVVYRDL